MKLVIIGGVAGGAAAAARARRLSEDAEIIIIERGEFISFANCGLPYYIGGEIVDRGKLLVATPQLFKNRFRVDVRLNSTVTAIDRSRKTVTVKKQDGTTYDESYDKLVVSTGAEPVRPDIPGIDSERIFTLRTIPDMDRIVEQVETNDTGRAMVIGGGFIGLEMAENLKKRGLDVAIVEKFSQVMPAYDREMAEHLHREIEQNHVALFLNTGVISFKDNGKGVEVALDNGQITEVDFVIIAIGVKPESSLAEDAGLDTGLRGAIAVDSHMRTSDPDIYAVGDAVQISRYIDGKPALLPLAGPAAKEARVAVNNMFGIDSAFRGIQGTSVCRVFELTAAITGFNEKMLADAGIPFDKVYVHPANHVGYFPGSFQMTLKVLYNSDNGRVLGAQCIGPAGIDKRIDVISMAIQGKMTMDDLAEAELCYAPPYGAAKDPVNFAGYVAQNKEDGVMPLTHWDTIADMNPDEYIVLDVRTSLERSAGKVPGSVHIPVDDLRDRLDELAVYRDRLILPHCAVGIRSYIAARILKHNGFNVANISGGFRTYCQFHPEECHKLTRVHELRESFCTTPRGIE